MPSLNLAKPKMLKVIILGDSGVGKTSLMRSFVNRYFISSYKSTLGADFMLHELNIDGQQITLQIWDTAGQERFSRLASTYYRGADCCMFVYDVTSVISFKNLEVWWDDFLVYGNPAEGKDFPCLVVGNKTDLSEKRVITVERANKWCQKSGNFPHIEVSAKESHNVSMAFKTLAKLALAKEKPVSTAFESIKLDDDLPAVKESYCC